MLFRSALLHLGCNPVVYSNFDSKSKLSRRVFKFRLRENIFSMTRLVFDYAKLSLTLKKEKTDVCVLHGFRMGFLDWLFMKLLAAGRKVILIVHDPESLIGLSPAKGWRGKMFGRASRLIVHNQFSKDALCEKIPESLRSKVTLIAHGNLINAVSPASGLEDFMNKHRLQRNQKHILFFGQIKETKGLDILLKAFAKTDKSACLVIAGRLRRHSFEPYQRLIDEYGLQEYIRIFPGYVNSEDRNLLFSLADVVVLPYRKVYQSGVMLMAMSYGKAVLASDLAPNMEIISNRQNGFIFKSEDDKDLSEQLTDVLKDDAGRRMVAENGYQFVLEKLNWDNIAMEWIKVLQS